MNYNDWKDKTANFKKVDVRNIQGNFFPGLKMQAMKLAKEEGMEIIQTFDPLPLYEVMEGLGFEHHTEQVAEHEFQLISTAPKSNRPTRISRCVRPH